jgi:ribosomal protein S18 acetylase RimI-like enzyme
MAAHFRLSAGWAPHQARHLEELALNASGAFKSLVYDGWLLGYRKGRSKRLRCVNPFYRSSFALDRKLEYCIEFYRDLRLPALFRLLPFSQPPELDRFLDERGWSAFERTLVLVSNSSTWAHARAAPAVELVALPSWVEMTSALLELDDEAAADALERARSYPLPQIGAIVRQDGELAACGMASFEKDCAGIFAVKTADRHRGRGYARSIVATLLAECLRRGTNTVYLQVTADNLAALGLYRRFGLSTAYDYWYRARAGEQS